MLAGVALAALLLRSMDVYVDFPNNLARVAGVVTGYASLSGWSAARALQGYAQKLDGTYTLFSSGSPRITDRGFLIELAATNLALYSRDMTNVAWVKVNMTAAATDTSIDGLVNTAMTLMATSASATILQTLVASATTRTYSVRLKRVTGTGTVNISGDGATWTPVTLTTSYQTFSVAASGLNPAFGIQIATSGDVIAADINQVEATAYYSSPIVTTVASVARPADVVSFSISGLDYPLTLWADFERAVDYGVSQTVLQVDDASANNRAILNITSGDVCQVQAVTAGASVVATAGIGSAVAVGAVVRLVGAFSTNDSQGAARSALSAADSVCAMPATPSKVRIGATTAGNQAGCYVKRVGVAARRYGVTELLAMAA